MAVLEVREIILRDPDEMEQKRLISKKSEGGNLRLTVGFYRKDPVVITGELRLLTFAIVSITPTFCHLSEVEWSRFSTTSSNVNAISQVHVFSPSMGEV